MNQERLIWKGQRSDAEARVRALSLEAAGIVRQMRFDLNPMSDIADMDTAGVARQAQRLDAIRFEVETVRAEIAKLDELLNG